MLSELAACPSLTLVLPIANLCSRITISTDFCCTNTGIPQLSNKTKKIMTMKTKKTSIPGKESAKDLNHQIFGKANKNSNLESTPPSMRNTINLWNGFKAKFKLKKKKGKVLMTLSMKSSDRLSPSTRNSTKIFLSQISRW